MTEAEILESLADPSVFQRVFRSGLALAEAGKEFPKHAKALIEASGILTNPEEYRRIVSIPATLIKLAEAFPQHAEALIQGILTNPEEYRRIVSISASLIELAEAFPQHTEALCNTALEKTTIPPSTIERILSKKEAITKEVRTCIMLLVQGIFKDRPSIPLMSLSRVDPQVIAEIAAATLSVHVLAYRWVETIALAEVKRLQPEQMRNVRQLQALQRPLLRVPESLLIEMLLQLRLQSLLKSMTSRQ